MQKRIVTADFSRNANTAFYNSIMEKVNDIDIGVVVLNAGVSHYGYFMDKEPA